MKLAGLEKDSFVDYPGKISAVLFTPGCNMDCFYCHNRWLIENGIERELLNMHEVLAFLKSRKSFLDGVVISGGEPTLQTGLVEFISTLKEAGFAVKLDTNGTRPKVLMKLINDRLVDYIAMDVKASFDKYSDICCTSVPLSDIQHSMDILLQGRTDYEFRTTFAPQLNEKDILFIGEKIKGAKLYVLQRMRMPPGRQIEGWNEYYCSNEYILDIAKKLKQFVQRVETRGF